MADALNPLVMQKRFSAQHQGSIQSAVDTLSALEIEDSFIKREITLAPIQRGRLGYQFTCYLKRQQRLWSYTTAQSEGRLWQDADGTVFLEGVAQINGWAFALGLAAFSIVFVLFLLVAGIKGAAVIACFLLYHLWSFYRDRNAAIMPLVHAIETFPAEAIKKKPLTAADLRAERSQREHPLF